MNFGRYGTCNLDARGRIGSVNTSSMAQICTGMRIPLSDTDQLQITEFRRQTSFVWEESYLNSVVLNLWLFDLFGPRAGFGGWVRLLERIGISLAAETRSPFYMDAYFCLSARQWNPLQSGFLRRKSPERPTSFHVPISRFFCLLPPEPYRTDAGMLAEQSVCIIQCVRLSPKTSPKQALLKMRPMPL